MTPSGPRPMASTKVTAVMSYVPPAFGASVTSYQLPLPPYCTTLNRPAPAKPGGTNASAPTEPFVIGVGVSNDSAICESGVVLPGLIWPSELSGYDV